MLDFRKRGCSYQRIADELDRRRIPPPAAYAVNEFQSGTGWSKMAVQRLCKRHGIEGEAPPVSEVGSHVWAGG